jgi:hypothetical protein
MPQVRMREIPHPVGALLAVWLRETQAKAEGVPVTAVLCNETAFATFRFSWVGSDGARCEIQWGEGMSTPLAIRNNFPSDLRHAERFGFSPVKPTVAKFKAFVQAFADAFEADDDDLEEFPATESRQ